MRHERETVDTHQEFKRGFDLLPSQLTQGCFVKSVCVCGVLCPGGRQHVVKARRRRNPTQPLSPMKRSAHRDEWLGSFICLFLIPTHGMLGFLRSVAVQKLRSSKKSESVCEYGEKLAIDQKRSHFALFFACWRSAKNGGGNSKKKMGK